MGNEWAVYCIDFEPRRLPYNSRTPGLIIKNSIVFHGFLKPMPTEMLVKSKDELMVSMKSMFGDDRYCDITFEMDGGQLKAHKFVLAARSPVLAAMFDSDFEETKSNLVQVRDVEFCAMKTILMYIYTGEVEFENDLDIEFGIKVYEAADKYDLKLLRDAMEEFVKFNVCCRSVVSALIAAHLHNSSRLKEAAIKYIVSHEGSEIDNIEVLQSQFTDIYEEIRTVSLAAKLDNINIEPKDMDNLAADGGQSGSLNTVVSQ